MVKNKGKQSNGRTLIKNFNNRHNIRNGSTIYVHTSQVTENKDAIAIKFRSQPEESQIESVLYKIQSDPNRSFTSTRRGDEEQLPLNILTEEEEAKIKQVVKTSDQSNVRIPRRPKWNNKMNAEELQEVELQSFYSWRRILYTLHEKKGMYLTPYEKNIEFWRQLWRVTERSDLLVQIVDARDPLLYMCADLKKYVHEQGPEREHLLLLNKADFLSYLQKKAWCDYFKKMNIKAVFFSALEEAHRIIDEVSGTNDSGHNKSQDHESFVMNNEWKNISAIGNDLEKCDKDEDMPRQKLMSDIYSGILNSSNNEELKGTNGENILIDEGEVTNAMFMKLALDEKLTSEGIFNRTDSDRNKSVQEDHECIDFKNMSVIGTNIEKCGQNIIKITKQKFTIDEKLESEEEKCNPKEYINQPTTLSRFELIKLFESYDNPKRYNEKHLTIGLVGYPNVGKSSTINCLLQDKKVAVSATPGKTKHFQTIYLSKELVLCDCPGLIFPAFVHNKDEMIISGILSIDQMKDYVGPIQEIISRIPDHVLETTYGIKLPVSAFNDNIRVKTEELLNTYGCIRGFMAPGGMPDRQKSARAILKDFVIGDLLYCKAPPDQQQKEYFIPFALKERRFNQKSVVKVLIKKQEIMGDHGDCDKNSTAMQTHFRTLICHEGQNKKFRIDQFRSKRNTHVKLRKRYPQDI